MNIENFLKKYQLIDEDDEEEEDEDDEEEEEKDLFPEIEEKNKKNEKNEKNKKNEKNEEIYFNNLKFQKKISGEKKMYFPSSNDVFCDISNFIKFGLRFFLI
jgi:hypothetical protein